jgi:hypothetical protein
MTPMAAPAVAQSADLAKMLIDHDVPVYNTGLVNEGDRFVVLCDKIGGRPVYSKNERGEQIITNVLPPREKGDVVSVADLGGAWEVCRLLARPRPFLRAATPFEATQAKVTVSDDPRKNIAVEEMLAEERRKSAAMVAMSDQKDAEIGRLRSLMAQPSPGVSATQQAEALAMKNQAIEALQRQNEALQAQLSEMARKGETNKQARR